MLLLGRGRLSSFDEWPAESLLVAGGDLSPVTRLRSQWLGASAIESRSTSKIRVELGGTFEPAPDAP